MAAFLRETRLAQVVLMVGLKIERRHIIEHHTDVPSKYPHGVMHADILYQMLVAVVQFVKVAVYPREIEVLVIVILQILNRSSLARRE